MTCFRCSECCYQTAANSGAIHAGIHAFAAIRVIVPAAFPGTGMTYFGTQGRQLFYIPAVQCNKLYQRFAQTRALQVKMHAWHQAFISCQAIAGTFGANRGTGYQCFHMCFAVHVSVFLNAKQKPNQRVKVPG
jgi:hypothetical protein